MKSNGFFNMNLTIKSISKLILSLGLILASTFLSNAQYDSIYHDGLSRTYLLHLPVGYTGIDSLPLIIAMHGGFGSAENLQNQSGLSEKADEEGFIVVYPEGVKGGILNIRTWNAGYCCGNASDNNIDDVGFIESLIDTLSNNYAINSNRIYATGISNGGFMSYRLACGLSDKIAAIAPVAASLTIDQCTPSRPVPVIHFHSYLDSNVPYLGGQGDGVSNHYNPPLDSVFNAFATMYNCSDINDTIINDSEITNVHWGNCDCGSEIQYYITTDGGHSWPGGTTTIIGDPVSNYINANDLMWSFFELHNLNCSPSGIEETGDINNENLILFPNPTSDYVLLTKLNFSDVFHVEIYDNLGLLLYSGYNENYIDLKNFSSGVYFLIFYSDEKIISRKLIVTKP